MDLVYMTNLLRTQNQDSLYVLSPDAARVLVCYRVWYWSDLDYESVWTFVQRHGGYISIGPDHCDYWILREYADLLVLAFGHELVRQPNLDYV
jgi:hypothetical protein